MKKQIFILIVILILSYNSIGAYKYYEEIETVEFLMNKRIEIMNSFIYGEKNLSILEEQLGKIEQGKLLSNDINVISKIIDNPTEYEVASKIEVLKVNKVETIGNNVSVNVDLKWFMIGNENKYTFSRAYNVDYTQRGSNKYLSEFKKISSEVNADGK